MIPYCNNMNIIDIKVKLHLHYPYLQQESPGGNVPDIANRCYYKMK